MKADRNDLQALQAVLRFLVVLGLDIIRALALICLRIFGKAVHKGDLQRAPACEGLGDSGRVAEDQQWSFAPSFRLRDLVAQERSDLKVLRSQYCNCM